MSLSRALLPFIHTVLAESLGLGRGVSFSPRVHRSQTLADSRTGKIFVDARPSPQLLVRRRSELILARRLVGLLSGAFLSSRLEGNLAHHVIHEI